MSREYRIQAVTDFLALSPDQRNRCVVDLLAWAEFMDGIQAAMPGVFLVPPEMVWVDDDRTGEVSAVILQDLAGSELSRTDFPQVKP